MNLQSKPRGISSAQLVTLLLVSRLFTIFTFAPQEGRSIPGSTVLLTLAIGTAISLIAILPTLWLQKRGSDLLTAAAAIAKPYGVLVAALFGLFCLGLGGYTVSHFEFFMTSAVYQNSSPWLFLLGLTIAAAYAARLGLEAFSRLAVFLFGLIAVLCLLIICTLLPEMRLIYLENPMAGGLPDIWKGTSQAVFGNMEVVAFLLLFHRTKRPAGKTYVSYLLWALLFLELLSFTVLTTLGDYAGTRLFPLYTAATAAQLSVFGRLDILHIAMWVFMAFVRTTLYLYCGMVCLRRLFPKLSMGWSACVCAVLAGGAALFVASGLQWLALAGEWLYSPWSFGVLVIGLPLLTALLTKPKPKPKGENT